MPGTERLKEAAAPHQKHGKGRVLSYTALAYVVLLSACSTTKELVVLLPGEDGQVGAVTIAEPQRTTLLDTPLGAAKIDTKGRVKKDTLTEEEVNRTFAQALAAQPPKPIKFTLHFLENSTEITPESRSDLADLLAEVARRQAVEVEITGHTDHLGQAATNDRLSQERAEAVRDMLVKNGLKTSFIRTVGRGDREPLIPPQPGQKSEPRNRRVEVLVR
jgi:outer membrane protein OmpA-like peptidoglycan-associated protein